MRVGRHINEVCELFDIQVLCDIEAVGDGDDLRVKPCVALGCPGELAAGIPYVVVTPWFPTEEELDEFCELNINRFRLAAAACERGEAVPDATEWR
jgi:hypothetical protein